MMLCSVLKLFSVTAGAGLIGCCNNHVVKDDDCTIKLYISGDLEALVISCQLVITTASLRGES